MNHDLRYVKMKAQNKKTVQTSSKVLSFIETEDISYIHPIKDKILKKEEKNVNLNEINEETQAEDIFLNKIRNKQCLSTYKIENQKNFSVNKDIKNKKVDKNKSTSLIMLDQYQKKKKSLYH